MKSIRVKEFDKQKDNYILLDIREPEEILIAKIDPHVHIPMMEIPQRHQELDKEQSIVVLCHMGIRSEQVCQYLEQLGYDITTLVGGIDAWSVHVDLDLPRY